MIWVKVDMHGIAGIEYDEFPPHKQRPARYLTLI
jgi:hypothetical protein